MKHKNDELEDLIKRALEKIDIHVSPQVLERDIVRVRQKAVREYIAEVRLRGRFCIRKGCGRKLKGREILFCSAECGISFHNDKKSTARIAKDPTYPSRKQAKWRKAKALAIRKEYPGLKNKVDEQERQVSDLVNKIQKLERDNDELREELSVSRNILAHGQNISKSFKLSNPESDVKSNISKKHRI